MSGANEQSHNAMEQPPGAAAAESAMPAQEAGRLMSSMVALLGWVDARLPVIKAWETHLSKYHAPSNFNFWYFFGVLSLAVLVIQILSGIWLTMNYTASSEEAFASIEYIMRDVEWGWLLRYVHSTGASAFFFVVYVHMFRGLMYGSYQRPRELIWVFGMAIYLILVMEGFPRLRAALGPDVVLGRQCHCVADRRDSDHRRRLADLGARRLPDLRGDAEPVLRTPRGRPATGAHRPGGAASAGAA